MENWFPINEFSSGFGIDFSRINILTFSNNQLFLWIVNRPNRFITASVLVKQTRYCDTKQYTVGLQCRCRYEGLVSVECKINLLFQALGRDTESGGADT